MSVPTTFDYSHHSKVHSYKRKSILYRCPPPPKVLEQNAKSNHLDASNELPINVVNVSQSWLLPARALLCHLMMSLCHVIRTQENLPKVWGKKPKATTKFTLTSHQLIKAYRFWTWKFYIDLFILTRSSNCVYIFPVDGTTRVRIYWSMRSQWLMTQFRHRKYRVTV